MGILAVFQKNVSGKCATIESSNLMVIVSMTRIAKAALIRERTGESVQVFRQKLRDERKQQGLTLRELSDRTGIDEPALSRLETGKNINPTLDTLDRVAAALGKVISCSLRDKES
jgi:DNA-binding Xre family transcriptional regulator